MAFTNIIILWHIKCYFSEHNTYDVECILFNSSKCGWIFLVA